MKTEAVQAIPDPKAGKKFDDAKAPLWSLIDYFPDALIAIAWVSEYGSRKYAWGGWKTVVDGIKRYFSAELRHAFLARKESYDEGDSGLPHKAQKAWNALADLQLAIESGEIEIRRGNDIENGKPVLGTARKAA